MIIFGMWYEFREIPGIIIKSKVKFKIWFIFMPWPAIHKTANNDSISRLNSRQKLPFPGNGKGKNKMPREGNWHLRIVFSGITGNGNSHSPRAGFNLWWYISGPMLGCSMPKPGAGVGFLRWGDMVDTSDPPQTQKRPFLAISTFPGSRPGRRVGPSCLPLNQDECHAAY